jgi:hypothetical protein
MTRTLRPLFVGITVAMLMPAAAAATPIATLTLLSEAQVGLSFEYEVVLTNGAHPVIDAGADLYFLAISFPATVQLLDASVPAGWAPTFDSTFFSAISDSPGTPPAGTDIAPGDSLGGFRLLFDQQVGSLGFDVLFTNVDDPGSPIPYVGVSTTVVPEPSSLLFCASGIALLYGLRRRRDSSV